MRNWFSLLNKRIFAFPNILVVRLMIQSFPFLFQCWPYTALQNSRMARICLMWHVNFLLTLIYFSLMTFNSIYLFGCSFLVRKSTQTWLNYFPRISQSQNQDLISSWILWKRIGLFRLLAEIWRQPAKAGGMEEGALSCGSHSEYLLHMVSSNPAVISSVVSMLGISQGLLQLNEKQQQQQKLKVCD